ncbi:hypothetical protein [Hymenobacter ruricola]|uniref:Uncharacterized protein n=1 Tax=Hymenobacter ruricola TaxID=2791023 RepID=A0ABS0I0X9_9BACT|nr:hypothetical protein [Hymenobacter ruricola]MBF9220601.1 hypothetical protein [Hymenobacter ruricola]
MDSAISDNPRTVPDSPVDIGYKCSWFAVRNMDTQALASLLGLKYVLAYNWRYGIAAAQSGDIFISPPIQEWRLVLGNTLPFGDSEASWAKVVALLTEISQVAGEAQFFATHRVTEFQCWTKARAGAIVREYAYLGEAMQVIRDTGARAHGEPDDLLTAETIYALENNEDLKLHFPDEETVMAVAGAWSVNPNEISKGSQSTVLGLVGTLSER